jgi:ATP-dependent DNA helicase PIF1
LEKKLILKVFEKRKLKYMHIEEKNKLNDIVLSLEQQKAYDKYIQGENIFISGSAGTGKSELIRKIYFDAKRCDKNIAVTALTGCAAILLGCKAKTVHSWASVGLASGAVHEIVEKIERSFYKKQNWFATEILVIDEVSMMSKKMFKLLNEIGKRVRRNKSPFGGIQLIFCGDFYQLPPVGNKQEDDTCQFCFEHEDWFNAFPVENHILLIKIFRQKDDTYASILNQIRCGKIKKSSHQLLLNHVGKPLSGDLGDIVPTKLFPRKDQVVQINQHKMNELDGGALTYTCIKSVDSPFALNEEDYEIRKKFTPVDIETEIEFIKSNAPFDPTLTLKVGAQVMCIVNKEEQQLFNGIQGIVLQLNPMWVLVKFNKIGEVKIMFHSWKSEKIPGVGVGQLPLMLAWALTIHKSQGATLDYAEIDVGSGVFECGQTYVALSRVKSLEGVYLSSFDVSKIYVNKKVCNFYDDLIQKQNTFITT